MGDGVCVCVCVVCYVVFWLHLDEQAYVERGTSLNHLRHTHSFWNYNDHLFVKSGVSTIPQCKNPL